MADLYPILICSRCLREDNTHEDDGIILVHPERMVCGECLTQPEVDEDLRRMGIEPEGLAERMLSQVYATLLNKGHAEAAESIGATLDRLSREREVADG